VNFYPQLVVKTIIFDFGGVLLEWHPDRVYRSYFPDETALQSFYAETQIMHHNRELDRGQPFDRILRQLAAQYPQHSEPLKLWKSAWHKMLGGAIEGTVEILYTLEKSRYRLFGLTNWAAETFPYVYYKHDFFQLFEDIVVSGREGMIKPEPEIFDLCLSRNQIRAEDCLFIDDNLENVQAAEQLGMQAIHFRDPNQLRQSLMEMKIRL